MWMIIGFALFFAWAMWYAKRQSRKHGSRRAPKWD